MKKYFNYVIKIAFTLIIFIVLINILKNYHSYYRLEDEGLLLTLFISFLVGFNSSLRRLYKEGGRLDKSLILLSFYWLALSSSYLAVFHEYDFGDYFGEYALYTTSILLFPIVFLIIGRAFYKVYKDSL